MGKKILLIDDQPDILEVLTEILEMLDHEVVAITSGHSLNKTVFPADFDIIITDYQMPDMTGVEIAKKINCICPGKKVYIISGYHQLLSDKKMQEYGVSGILNKPFELEELKKVVDG